MDDHPSASITARSSGRIPLAKPRWGFWKGALTGVAVEVPALTAAIWVLARLGIGNPDVPVMQIMRLTAVFAGVAAIFTAGGIGRLSAYASIDGGRRRAVFVAARAHAVASAGLVLIAAIPQGHLPGHSLAWLAYPAAGVVTGAASGALIGLVCGGTAPVELADVWSLARKPSEALLSWLDPRELVRLGAAVRHRTSHLFEGMFDPAPPPPPDAKPPAADDPSPPAKSE
ncbi:MAG: hypothetical protein E6J91_34240 [Deltaproteobacteria bacterium]|nr:MAG: hypothetical protein E6J91_34240 [Deltaproteobacteria bacterium]